MKKIIANLAGESVLLMACAIQLSMAASEPQLNSVTVYVTRTGKKYHRIDCRYVHGKVTALSLQEAAKRYAPCAVCQPPTMEAPSATAVTATATPAPTTTAGAKESSTAETTATDKTIYEGPRGGRYHYSKSGKKVYEKKRK